MDLVPSPAQHPEVDWAAVRRLYVQGVAVGPGLPNRDEILDALGLAGILDKKGSRQGNPVRQITRLGKFRVVFPGLDAVGNYYGVPAWPGSPLHLRSKEEDWPGLQSIYRAQLRQRAGTLAARSRLANVEKIDHRAFNVARVGLKMVEARLAMMAETVEVVGDDVVTGAWDSREMESLARCAQSLHSLGRRSLGFPVDKVGVVGVGDAMEMAEHGLSPLNGVVDEEEEDAQLGRELVAGVGSVDAEAVAGLTSISDPAQSVTSELAKDDAARLHGFLTVLGRAQDASVADPDRDLDALDDTYTGSGAPDSDLDETRTA